MSSGFFDPRRVGRVPGWLSRARRQVKLGVGSGGLDRIVVVDELAWASGGGSCAELVEGIMRAGK